MHFRFHVDRDGFQKEFRTEFGGRWAGRGSRWAAFARAFADEFGDDGPSRTDGPRRRRRFGAEALRILLLHLLKEEPRHGYELIKTIEGLSAGLYSPSPGMIYPMLNMLADEGLIVELAAEEGRRRYAITDAGRAALDAAEEQLKEALQRLADMAGAMRNDARQPLRAGMHDLRDAVRRRMREGDDEAALAQRIADILKDAADKIGNL
jgi:DNA-binding PadR family transcriptional regulator